MKRSVSIELLEEHTKASFFQMRFSDEKESEFDKFWNKFSTLPKHNRDMNILSYWMDKIGNETGIGAIYLREEGRVFLKALPIDHCKLRVYVFIVKDIVLLFAGGGQKKTKTYQEDPILHAQVEYVRKAGNKILRYIELGKITIIDNKLKGKLTFEIEV